MRQQLPSWFSRRVSGRSGGPGMVSEVVPWQTSLPEARSDVTEMCGMHFFGRPIALSDLLSLPLMEEPGSAAARISPSRTEGQATSV